MDDDPEDQRSGVLFEEDKDNNNQPTSEHHPRFNAVEVFPCNKPPARRKREDTTLRTQSKRPAARGTAASSTTAAASSSITTTAAALTAAASTTTTTAATSALGLCSGLACNPCQIETHNSSRGTDLLDDQNVVDKDELYGENERALSNFIRLHPMLSLDATSDRMLSKVAEMIEESQIECKEIEVVTKEHDDLFLRPAKSEINERSCVNEEKCVCRWTAIFRHGENSDRAFVCREYLLPSQQKVMEETGELPKTVGKCLICTRYFTHYIYTLARNSPKFCPKKPIQLQAFCNKISVPSPLDVAPSHASSIGTVDGYRASVMLFVDEKWADTSSSRNEMAALMWKPTVRFHSSDYEFKIDSEGTPRAIQVGMAIERLDFGSPLCS